MALIVALIDPFKGTPLIPISPFKGTPRDSIFFLLRPLHHTALSGLCGLGTPGIARPGAFSVDRGHWGDDIPLGLGFIGFRAFFEV